MIDRRRSGSRVPGPRMEQTRSVGVGNSADVGDSAWRDREAPAPARRPRSVTSAPPAPAGGTAPRIQPLPGVAVERVCRIGGSPSGSMPVACAHHSASVRRKSATVMTRTPNVISGRFMKRPKSRKSPVNRKPAGRPAQPGRSAGLSLPILPGIPGLDDARQSAVPVPGRQHSGRIRKLPLQIATRLLECVGTAEQTPVPLCAKLDDERGFSARIVRRGEQYVGVQEKPHRPGRPSFPINRPRSSAANASSASHSAICSSP